jgi:hypothetical protein
MLERRLKAGFPYGPTPPFQTRYYVLQSFTHQAVAGNKKSIPSGTPSFRLMFSKHSHPPNQSAGTPLSILQLKLRAV